MSRREKGSPPHCAGGTLVLHNKRGTRTRVIRIQRQLKTHGKLKRMAGEPLGSLNARNKDDMPNRWRLRPVRPNDVAGIKHRKTIWNR